MTQWTSKSIQDLPQVARAILDRYAPRKVFALYGEMGAGKTTLTKAFLEVLGAHDAGHSPTYSLVNEYQGTDNHKIYHFDMYRLNDEEEAYDYGVEDYFADTDAYIFIEWPEKTPNLLPDNCVELKLTVNVEARIIEEI